MAGGEDGLISFARSRAELSRTEREAARYAARAAVELDVQLYLAEAKIDALVSLGECVMDGASELAAAVRKAGEDEAKRQANVAVYADVLLHCRNVIHRFAKDL